MNKIEAVAKTLEVGLDFFTSEAKVYVNGKLLIKTVEVDEDHWAHFDYEDIVYDLNIYKYDGVWGASIYPTSYTVENGVKVYSTDWSNNIPVKIVLDNSELTADKHFKQIRKDILDADGEALKSYLLESFKESSMAYEVLDGMDEEEIRLRVLGEFLNNHAIKIVAPHTFYAPQFTFGDDDYDYESHSWPKGIILQYVDTAFNFKGVSMIKNKQLAEKVDRGINLLENLRHEVIAEFRNLPKKTKVTREVAIMVEDINNGTYYQCPVLYICSEGAVIEGGAVIDYEEILCVDILRLYDSTLS